MIQQKITEIAEILGWSVDFSEPQNGKTDVNFAKYTPDFVNAPPKLKLVF